MIPRLPGENHQELYRIAEHSQGLKHFCSNTKILFAFFHTVDVCPDSAKTGTRHKSRLGHQTVLSCHCIFWYLNPHIKKKTVTFDTYDDTVQTDSCTNANIIYILYIPYISIFSIPLDNVDAVDFFSVSRCQSCVKEKQEHN